MVRELVSVLWLIVCSLPLFSQMRQYTIKDKKAIEYYEKGLSEYHYEYYAKALNSLEKAKRRNAKFLEAYLLSAQIYETLQQFDEAYIENIKALSLDSTFYPKVQLDAARMAYYSQQYALGAELAARYLLKIAPSDRGYINASLIQRSCLFAMETIKNPVAIQPVALPPSVNTVNDEYFPSISADELTISVTRLLPTISQGRREAMQEDLYLAKRLNRDDIWQEAEDIGAPVSTPYNEGSQSLSSDGKRMYYSFCNGPCKIYCSTLNEQGVWSTPVALPPTINVPYVSTKQPSISADGRTLYFTSNRPGGYGGYDLWVAHQNEKGEWGEVRNLGATINTPWEEQSPFIHFDNKTLYFSSNGHPGLGDLDLYKTERRSRSDTVWSEPRNLGYPINTPATDMGLVVAASGENAYYASSRNERQGMDIYTFRLPDSLRPSPVSYLRGTVQDATNGTPLAGDCLLVDLTTGEEVMRVQADVLGNFLVCLPMGRQYALFASYKGYFDYSLHFDFVGTHSASEPFQQIIGLMPIRTGVSLTLRNVFFDIDADVLKPESHLELDRWCKVMQDRPTMRIQIEGHTDNSGSVAHNLQLSERRARSVMEYLRGKGIEASRLSCKGFGASKPAQSNNSEAGRAANRRTECRIIAL